ncbi:tripartite tricarboxylate transporter substrate binding protein [Variovorax sp. OV329]|uniref:Bug family tripartite tricarboxylate transporter substrate binding protein n=1 Tax=Variovorax sp. OV329 TaxID=1882825 RepID=UPI0008EC2EF9|nr:tripartite tricarboxylate transporter substrate binding protein [Variovorax sp. OV329]SFM46753.1 Tripartite-type tricarboxylate transporter, receptor component TctC [Variovorax sp. OV329]
MPTPVVSRRAALALIALSGPLASVPALAQKGYPAKPIKILIGYAPGGSVDMVGRVAADILSAKLGATVVVENAPGAAGSLAAQRLVNSPADGYTLLAGSSNELIGTGLVNPAQKYDGIRDMTPVGMLGSSAVVLVASPKVPVKNIDEFIALVKRNPGKYSYGSSGVGSTLHLAAELLKERAGLFMTHIPYRGTASLSSDLVGGTLDFAVMSPTGAAPFIASGRITPLAVTSQKRFPTLGQVPALAETPQLKGFDLSGWYAMMAPRGLPPEIAKQLADALRTGLAEPAFRNRMEGSGVLAPSGNEDLAKMLRDDQRKYADIVKFANIRE